MRWCELGRCTPSLTGGCTLACEYAAAVQRGWMRSGAVPCGMGRGRAPRLLPAVRPLGPTWSVVKTCVDVADPRAGYRGEVPASIRARQSRSSSTPRATRVLRVMPCGGYDVGDDIDDGQKHDESEPNQHDPEQKSRTDEVGVATSRSEYRERAGGDDQSQDDDRRRETPCQGSGDPPSGCPRLQGVHRAGPFRRVARNRRFYWSSAVAPGGSVTPGVLLPGRSCCIDR
jgi:hypothetical protein